MKCNCINGNFVNGARESTLHSFASDRLKGHKISTERRKNSSKRKIEPVLSQITVHLENVDHRPVDCNGETLTFFSHLNNI